MKPPMSDKALKVLRADAEASMLGGYSRVEMLALLDTIKHHKRRAEKMHEKNQKLRERIKLLEERESILRGIVAMQKVKEVLEKEHGPAFDLAGIA